VATLKEKKKKGEFFLSARRDAPSSSSIPKKKILIQRSSEITYPNPTEIASPGSNLLLIIVTFSHCLVGNMAI